MAALFHARLAGAATTLAVALGLGPGAVSVAAAASDPARAANPAAPAHLPFFITAPGDTDVLMVAMVLLLLAAVVGIGVIFLTLHSLPERLAHKSQKLQFEIVAVLCLLALFTHIHLFWVAGLLLALIDLPDFGTPLRRIAAAVERLAGRNGPTPADPEGDGPTLEVEAIPPAQTRPTSEGA